MAQARVTVRVDDSALQSLIQPGGVLYRHAAALGETVATVARLRVGVRTGRLRQSIGSRVIVRRLRVTARISARPKYALVHHEGRGPVVARPGKVLRIPLGNGEFAYRKRVGPAKPNRFLTDAVRIVTGKTPRLRDAAPDGA